MSDAPLNRLAHEPSPYLLQHASNPVDWYPWSDEAFDRARREDKPIFLSIGYATCHWCHVMERESFEDPVVASLMNAAFVNIKVDREERPDIDQVYMSVCQMLTGSGGWPLTIVMSPDRRPFFAATYLPRETRHGRLGMVDLVPRVVELWRSDRDRVLASADRIVGELRTAASRHGAGAIDRAAVEICYRQLRNRYDERYGGFGDRPKFPSPHNLLFLLQYWRRTGEDQALRMAEHTLQAMRMGGIFDHLGYGFHRYSTDREWLVPHFEKMLYDQAMLTLAYSEAFQATGRPEYRRAAREVIEYVLRDMTAPEGAFYSAEDADSEGEEGRFYLWTTDQVRTELDDQEAALAVSLYNLSPEGNFDDEATQRRTGANILHLRHSHLEAARRMGLEPPQLERLLEGVRAKLFAARATRVPPLKDDKVLADWNGLMAAALARAGRVFGDPRALAAARAAVEWVLGAMRSPNGRLMHRYRDGSLSVPGFLDDSAFLTWACLELYDATLDPANLERALALTDDAIERFWDRDRGGFFLTGSDAEPLPVRPKEAYDGAAPSGNSVALANLVRLARITGRSDLSKRADDLIAAFAEQVNRAPSAHGHLLAAVQAATGPSLEIVVTGDPGAADTARLLAEIRSRYLPHAALVLVPDGAAGDAVRRLAPFTEPYRPIDGSATAYVCRDFRCELPITDPDRLAEMLESAAR